ncbi:MAG: hypothetical protein LBP38_05075 [Desulfovibrio sp.]|jgi:hypothetical protein|nr:hypothetical protein [Desulfovibrio sp.]
MKRLFPQRLFPALAACLLTIAVTAPTARAADAAGAGGIGPASAQSKAETKSAVEPASKAGSDAQAKSAPDDAAGTGGKTPASVRDKDAAKSDAKPAAKADAKPAAKADAKPAAKADAKPAAKGTAAPGAGKKTASKPAPAAGKNADEVLHQKLEAFGRDAIETMNRHALPSQGKKEVLKNKDGSYTARYVSIDPASLSVSFKKAEPPAGTVSHIGYLRYVSKEYFCTASTESAAKNGPFEPRMSRGHTELIKYVRGKWSY